MAVGSAYSQVLALRHRLQTVQTLSLAQAAAIAHRAALTLALQSSTCKLWKVNLNLAPRGK